MSFVLCKFCGLDTRGGAEICGACRTVFDDGRSARLRMFPMESCPWLNARHELVDVYGEPEYHDDAPLGTRGSCPWCSGWGDAERELFDQARGGA